MATTSDGTTVILNPVLTYVKYLMGCETKLSIQNIVCSKFELDVLKTARETLYKSLAPDEPYRYNGPKSSTTDAEKSVHALEGILTKLQQLDRNASSIVFACPSYDFSIINPSSGNSVGDDISMFRMNKMEKDIDELKSMKSRFDDLQNTVIAMITSADVPPPRPALIPTGDPNEFPPIPRDRSASTVSNKRTRGSESDVDPFTVNDGFRLSRNQRKKVFRDEKRQKVSSTSGTESYANKIINGTPKVPKKKQFQWGKATEDPSSGFKGLIPELFITRCSVDTQPEQVANHLQLKGITIKKIERKSREEAPFKSFKITVNSSEDFEKILSGEPLPHHVQVRKWIYYTNKNNESSFKKSLAELDSLEKSILNSGQSKSAIPGLQSVDLTANDRMDDNSTPTQ